MNSLDNSHVGYVRAVLIPWKRKGAIKGEVNITFPLLEFWSQRYLYRQEVSVSPFSPSH